MERARQIEQRQAEAVHAENARWIAQIQSRINSHSNYNP
jgi:hypothetical protein